MNDIIGENHQKISIGRTTQQLLFDLKNQGFEISKSWLLEKTNELNLKEKNLVFVQKIWTKAGGRNTNIYTKEGTRQILMSVKKIFPEQKKDYLIESTKPKTMSLAEIKQFGLALAGMSDELIGVKEEVKLLQNEQNMCRVSAIKDDELKDFSREIITNRLYKKGLVYEDASARSKEYAYLRSYLKEKIQISRITNLNAKEHQLVRETLIDLMEWEGIPY